MSELIFTDNSKMEEQLLPGGERGIFIVLFAVVLLALLAMVGLTIDTGMLTLQAAQAQRSVDAAALVGTAHIGVLSETDLVDLARGVARDNLERNNVRYATSNPNQDISVVLDETDRTLSVAVSSATEPFIMGKVASAQSRFDLIRKAKGKKRPLAVAIAADLSSSMLCRASGGPEPCDYFGGSRLEALLGAGLGFIDSLNEKEDAIAIIGFAGSTTVVFEMSHPFSAREVKDALMMQSVGYGETNIHAGLAAARAQMAKLESLVGTAGYNDFVKVIALVTDGAPTISNLPARFLPSACRGLRKQRHFIWPILEADQARQDGILVYTVGVGAEDPITDSPWQGGYKDHMTLKPYFLRRLANHADAATEDPAFPDPCIPTYLDMMPYAQGEYQSSLDANDLQAMLNRLWRSSQLRLIE